MSETASPPPKKSRPRWQRWGIDALIFVVLVIALQLWQARDTPRGAAPPFAGQLLDGRPFDLASWRAERPGEAHLLYFWADWCAVCKTTAGSVSAIAADWPVTSIASQSGPAPGIGQLMAERGYAWPTLADPAGALLKAYGLPGVPAFIIIDPAGDIRSVSVGYTSEIGLRVRLWLASQGKP